MKLKNGDGEVDPLHATHIFEREAFEIKFKSLNKRERAETLSDLKTRILRSPFSTADCRVFDWEDYRVMLKRGK